MTPREVARRLMGLAVAVATLTGCARGGMPAADGVLAPQPDVIFVATDVEVVRAMLTLARVTPDDVVFDLGCGDGRIVIAAAKEFGARGVGVDIDPRLIQAARAGAERAGVGDRVVFRVEDLFATDLSTATVVTLFLSPTLNARLQPKLVAELPPGARIVSHRFGIGDWTPERAVTVTVHERRNHIFLWRAPGRP